MRLIRPEEAKRSMDVVELVMQSKAGVKLLVSQALFQQNHYAQLLKKQREFAASMTSLAPVLVDIEKDLKEKPGADSIAKCVQKLPAFLDQLPPGLCLRELGPFW